MDFEQLRIFMVLTEERTFLGAANRLATSRSRIRRKLDRLEADAATTLLERRSTGLVLTPAGAALAHRGRMLLDQADQLIRHVRDVGEEPTGCLRIALSPGPMPPGLEAACRRLQDDHPRLSIAIRHAVDPIALLPTDAEVALAWDADRSETARAYGLGDYHLRLVASESYLEARGRPETPDDLAAHRLALWRAPTRPTDRLPLRSGGSLAVAPVLESEDPRHVLAEVAAGRCIGFLPDLPALNDPSWKGVLPDGIAGRIGLRLVVPDVVADRPRVERFVALCTTPPSPRARPTPSPVATPVV